MTITTRPRTGVRRTPRVQLAAGLVLTAEVGHLLAIIDEWPLWALRGVFHTLAAIAQGLLAASLLFGLGPKTLQRGIRLNLLLPILWLFTRTLGFPSLVTLQRLPVGFLDTLTTAVEVAVAAVLIVELRMRRHEAKRSKTDSAVNGPGRMPFFRQGADSDADRG